MVFMRRKKIGIRDFWPVIGAFTVWRRVVRRYLTAFGVFFAHYILDFFVPWQLQDAANELSLWGIAPVHQRWWRCACICAVLIFHLDHKPR